MRWRRRDSFKNWVPLNKRRLIEIMHRRDAEDAEIGIKFSLCSLRLRGEILSFYEVFHADSN
jgi:hypothetical protein